MEDLNKLNINDSELGTCFNRLLTRNLWKRTSFDKNLEKRAKDLNSKLFRINPAYSSFIGNIQYNYSDPINASLEVARRGYNVIIKKNKKFYPELSKDLVKALWKEHLTDEDKNWKSFYSKMKNSKMRYSVLLDELKGSFRVSRINSYKSKVMKYDLFI